MTDDEVIPARAGAGAAPPGAVDEPSSTPQPDARTSREVVLLSDLLRRRVRDQDGHPLGRLSDLVAQVREGQAVVRHLVVRRHGRAARADLLPGSDLLDGRRPPPVLDASAAPVVPAPPDDEVLLRRDVLDAQVADLQGHRLRRVSDVLLTRGAAGSAEVLAVDVGLGALLHRLGLRRTGSSRAPVLLRWSDLHLTSGRGHLAQLATEGAGLHRLDPAGLAELLARLGAPQAADVLEVVGPRTTAAALAVSHPTHQRRLLHLLDDDGVASVLAAAPAGARADLRSAAQAPVRRRHLRTSGWRVQGPRAVTHLDRREG